MQRYSGMLWVGRVDLEQEFCKSSTCSVICALQVTLESMFHQAYITNLQPVPSLCCLQPSYWEAPAARAFCNGASALRAAKVVMVFTCFADYQRIFRPGGQAVAEAIMKLYKACVLLAVSLEGGYECQEVRDPAQWPMLVYQVTRMPW